MKRNFWRGFAAGASAGASAAVGTVLLVSAIGRARKRHVVRLERSLQIGRPVEEVFAAWANLERLPQMTDAIREIRSEGNRSHWTVRMDSGRVVEWQAEIEQFIPNQAIGWKTLSGPKHTGRITFSPLIQDTLVQVTMNYVPPSRLLKPFVENFSGMLDKYLDRVLRDFKASLEGKGQEGRKPAVRTGSEKVGPGTEMTQTDVSRGTGTFGTPSGQTERFGAPVIPVDYTRPPEAKS